MKLRLAVTLRVACLVFALVWAACSSAPINRIDQHRAVYEEWPVETKQAVLDGQVTKGMTSDMVYVAWGAPTRILVGQMLAEETWLYEEDNFNGSSERRIVTFRVGAVHSVDVQRF